ncbi:histone H3 acetylation [Mactra antiquata]
MSEGERKTITDERRYAIITKESISVMADAAGHEDIDDNVAGILGEDVSYRLREITQKSAQFMRHARRRRMNTDDFNKACRHSDIQPIHGHGSSEAPAVFHQVKNDVGEVIHFTEDQEVNLATTVVNDYIPKCIGETTIKVHWLSVEGIQKTPQNPQGNKIESSDALLAYFDKITQAVLGFDSEMMKTALSDLRTNCNISPLLSHFVSFISMKVKTVSFDLRQLNKLLYMIQSLVFNSSLFLDAQPYLSQLVQSVQFCLFESYTGRGNTSTDHWSLRDYAARLLAHIISIWGNSVNFLERFTEKTYREVLYDFNKPFSAHYGAVMGLLYLGSENIERVVVPHLSNYWPHLMSVMEPPGHDYERQQSACKVYGALLLSVEHVIKYHIEQFKKTCMPEMKKSRSTYNIPPSLYKFKPETSSGKFMSKFEKSPLSFYFEMSEYFGDSLFLRLPELFELKNTVYKAAPKDVKPLINDSESGKSGEELLAELVAQVKQEENERKIKDEGFKKLKREERLFGDKQKYFHENWQTDYRQQLQAVQKQKTTESNVDNDNDIILIDVEGDNEKSDHSFNSEKSEEDVSMALKSSIGEPGQGIKLTFTKKPKLTQFSSDSPFSDVGDSSEWESTQGKKRKHSLSPDQGFGFEDIAGNSSYSQYGGFSSGSDRNTSSNSSNRSLTMKIRRTEHHND